MGTCAWPNLLDPCMKNPKFEESTRFIPHPPFLRENKVKIQNPGKILIINLMTDIELLTQLYILYLVWSPLSLARYRSTESTWLSFMLIRT